MNSKENPVKSREEGRPIFEDVEYVKIHIAGDPKNLQDRKVQDRDIERWPLHYKAFKEGLEAPTEGTPITEWPVIGEAKRRELLALNIKTLEALAELPEGGIARLGIGARELVKKAQAALEQAKGQAPMNALIDENEQLKARNEFLEEENAELKMKLKLATEQAGAA